MTSEPDWLAALRSACTATSQSRTALRLRVSAAVVNQALKGTYKGRLDKLEARVRGELMRETVACPVLGEISKRRCQDEQRRPFAVTNPQRVAIYRACRSGCAHSGVTS